MKVKFGGWQDPAAGRSHDCRVDGFRFEGLRGVGRGGLRAAGPCSRWVKGLQGLRPSGLKV